MVFVPGFIESSPRRLKSAHHLSVKAVCGAFAQLREIKIYVSGQTRWAK
jgi:hypothetical protein